MHFLELASDALGFIVKVATTKQDVGQHFIALGKKLEKSSEELEQIAVKATTGVDKNDSSQNLIRNAVDSAKTTLNILKEHLSSLGEVGDSNLVGEATKDQNGVSASTDELKKVYNALKGIVGIVTKEGKVKEPSVSSVTLASNSIGGASIKDGAKILAAGQKAGAAVGDKAAAIVSAVRGEEILAAIIESSEGDAAGTIGGNATGETSALKFARGGSTVDNLAQEAAKAGAVAGGIALRSLVKDGKLAAHSADDDKAAQAAGITAVNKLLRILENMIIKTVKNVLEQAKEKIDEARDPKEPVLGPNK
ncbi:Variable major outer membrane lipoprotein (plasmid) [Borrelia crocidurae DOU]|uniref:Variable large protein n=1 Tax=Borrelia crocidurae DOU TaxID=1293575 RepID=W5SIR3_9SPIR|nr:Variable major outer membrane lipoprotein [Borrelia crocidurae DOU]